MFFAFSGEDFAGSWVSDSCTGFDFVVVDPEPVVEFYGVFFDELADGVVGDEVVGDVLGLGG